MRTLEFGGEAVYAHAGLWSRQGSTWRRNPDDKPTLPPSSPSPSPSLPLPSDSPAPSPYQSELHSEREKRQASL